MVFDTSGTKANMRTGMFGLLDFHDELHWVNGSYDADRPARVLLKCNYYCRSLGLGAVAPAGHRAQRGDIVSPAAPVVLVLAVLALAVKAVAAPLAGLF